MEIKEIWSSIIPEGLSIRYREKEDHCIDVLDSAGQETPLLNNKELSPLKDDYKNEENNAQEEGRILDMDESETFERSLRVKLITETFIQQCIIETSHVLV